MTAFATDPGAQLTPMTPAELATGLTCGTLSIGQLNWIFQQLFAGTVDLVDCNGDPLPAAAAVATCADLSAAIAAIPAEKFLQGLQSYNAATNTMTLLLNDGSTVAIDMTNLLADAVATVPHVSAAVTGVVNNTALQELGGTDKLIHGVRVGTGNGNPFGTTVVGSGAGAANTGTLATLVGYNAGQNNTQVFGTFVGSNSGRNNTGSQSVGIGGDTLVQNTGLFATAVGSGACGSGVGGYMVTAVGFAAGASNASSNVTVIGGEAGRYNRAADLTAVGMNAAIVNGGASATFVGVRTGSRNAGDGTTAVGYEAGLSVGADYSSFFGYRAGQAVVLSAAQNVTAVDIALNQITVPAHGFGAVGSNITVVLSGALPAGAGFTPSTNVMTVIDANTLQFLYEDITSVGGAFTAQVNTINNHTNSTAVGANSRTTANNQVQLGDSAVTEVRTAGAYFGTAFNIVSDKRNKDSIEQIDGKQAAELSRRVTFNTFALMESFANAALDDEVARSAHHEELRADLRKAEVALAQAHADTENEACLSGACEHHEAVRKEAAKAADAVANDKWEPEPRKRRLLGVGAGVIAQELQEILAEFGQWQWIVTENATTGELTVDYTSLFAILSAGMQWRMNQAGI